VLVALAVACLAAIMVGIGNDWLNTLALLTFGIPLVAAAMIEFTAERPPSRRVQEMMLGSYVLLASFAMAALIAGYYQVGCDRVTVVVAAHGVHNNGSWLRSLRVTRTDSAEDIGYVIHPADDEVAVGDELEVYVDPRGWVRPLSGAWLPELLQYPIGLSGTTLMALFVMSALPRPRVASPGTTAASADIPSGEMPADSSGRPS